MFVADIAKYSFDTFQSFDEPDEADNSNLMTAESATGDMSEDLILQEKDIENDGWEESTKQGLETGGSLSIQNLVN